MDNKTYNQCLEYNCWNKVNNPNHDLCYYCYLDFEAGFINHCAVKNCEYYIHQQYETCYPHKDVKIEQSYTGNKIEYSPHWINDKDSYFVYILKLFNQQDEVVEIYIGQTKDINSRLEEHRDNTEYSTKGFKKELVYFNRYPSRDQATQVEKDLKDLKDTNPRKIQEIISAFRLTSQHLNKKF